MKKARSGMFCYLLVGVAGLESAWTMFARFRGTHICQFRYTQMRSKLE